MASPISSPTYSSQNTSTFLNHPLGSLSISSLPIAYPQSYLKFYPIWQTLRDLNEGELAVKSRGELYLRKLASQKVDDYRTYLARTPFYNAIHRTHQGLLGSIFRKSPDFSIPKNLKLPDTVTLDNLTLVQLTKHLVSEILLVGRAGLLVDFPDLTNQPQSTQTQTSAQTSPHIAFYNAESIVYWRTNLIKGRKTLDRVILREEVRVDNEYAYDMVPQFRVLRLDYQNGKYVYSQEIHRNASAEQIAKGINEDTFNQQSLIRKITPAAQGRTFDYIPFTFVNSDSISEEPSTPPLWHIATINLSHYQYSAQLSAALFYAGMPTYYITGATDEASPFDELSKSDPLAVGPNRIWYLGKDEKPGLLEFTGHGLTFLENAVESAQLQMQSLGGRLISAQRRSTALSSEAYSLMEGADEATLLDTVQATEDALKKTLTFLADFSNIENLEKFKKDLVLELNKEFIRTDLSAREIRAIQALYERQIIPLDVLYYTLRQVGIIPMEYSLEEFKNLLEEDSQLYEDPKLKAEEEARAEAARQNNLNAIKTVNQPLTPNGPKQLPSPESASKQDLASKPPRSKLTLPKGVK